MDEDPRKLTRRTTTAERDNIVGVSLDQADVDYFMDLCTKGLYDAAALHDAAVQEDMGLSAQVTISLSRPVREDDGSIGEVLGQHTVTGDVKARKIFDDTTDKPT